MNDQDLAERAIAKRKAIVGPDHVLTVETPALGGEGFPFFGLEMLAFCTLDYLESHLERGDEK